MPIFAIEKGHSPRWLVGDLAVLGTLKATGQLSARECRVMRKFAVGARPGSEQGTYTAILFKTSDLWLTQVPDFIQSFDWISIEPPGPWEVDEAQKWLDQLLGLELDDDKGFQWGATNE